MTDVDCKYGLLFNVATLHILANIFMSYFNFKYFDQYSMVANIFVSVIVISFSLFMLFNDYKSHRRPITLLWSHVWEDKKSTNVLIWTGLFIFLCLNNFVMIRYFSFLVNLYQEFQITHEDSIFLKIILLSSFLFGLIVAELYFYCKKNRESTINDDIKRTIDKYHLEFNKTYFFTASGHVHGFQICSYMFRPEIGLFDGKRWYSAPLVLEYLNLSGIGFKDLDENHIKNIEMYSIGS